ncbi:hypothetical protein B0A55_01745 [Friedmanniomyces simplex]|uniref:N-acetyltransferase domain-containing protein n=1 Tax=Friedmanniomyces simplex TaxID=329884 RepID=A0A4U0XZ23_9PEZI|nr:hypothetical protein B0A55_01745 [Friedmanniomyces simplex]
MKAVVDLQYRCFPPAIRKLFMGCSSPLQPGELIRYTDSVMQRMREDPHDIWIGVKDSQTGRLIAGSNWKVHMNGDAGNRQADEAPSWLEGEELEKSKRVIGKMFEMRQKAMPGPFIYLHICFTDQHYRRRGAGGMMLQWGCELADQLWIPGYIEASVAGNFLYKTFGFQDHEQMDSDIGEEGVSMKRDARSKPVEGGKAAPPT